MRTLRLAFTTTLLSLIVVLACEVSFELEVRELVAEEQKRSACEIPLSVPSGEQPRALPEYEFQTYLDQTTGTWKRSE